MKLQPFPSWASKLSTSLLEAVVDIMFVHGLAGDREVTQNKIRDHGPLFCNAVRVLKSPRSPGVLIDLKKTRMITYIEPINRLAVHNSMNVRLTHK
jgi:hypothetical protein